MKQHSTNTHWKILLLILLQSLVTACTNPKVTLPYNAPPLDVQSSIKSVRVNLFTSNNTRHRTHFKNTLVSLLAKEGAIKILTSGAESTLSGSLEIGRVITNQHTTSYKTKEKINGNKVEVTKRLYHYRKTFSASVTYQLTKNRQIIGGNSYQKQFDKTWNASSAQAARSNALTDQQLVNTILNDLATDIVRGISSHQTFIEFKLQKGVDFSTNEGLKTGVEYYQQGLYSQAESYWQQVLTREMEPKLKAAAYFNLGINQFREKRFAEAFKLFRSADQLHPANRDYMAAISITESTQLSEDLVQNLKVNSGHAYRLTVTPDPMNSRIRIMNIVDKYQPGIALVPGRYIIQVDHPGYFSATQKVIIRNQNLSINIVLNKR